MIKLPVATSDLRPYMPHRSPMVWVDFVEQVSVEGGICRIIANKDAHYCADNGIRWTAPIEWMAQAYGFVKAVQVVNGLITIPQIPKVTFLAQVRDAEVLAPLHCDEFLVKVTLRRALGPMSLVEGVVTDLGGDVIAKAGLKLFAQ